MNERPKVKISVGTDNAQSTITASFQGHRVSVTVSDEKLYADPKDPKSILHRLAPVFEQVINKLGEEPESARAEQAQAGFEVRDSDGNPVDVGAEAEKALSDVDSDGNIHARDPLVPSAPETKDLGGDLLGED